MKYSDISLLFPLLFTAVAAPAAETDAASRPNILLFMVDDMGWQDTSVPFADSVSEYNRIFRTPNMLRLADSGMMFTSAYASPISSPSRCSLITGANNARHRVTNWTLHRGRTTDGTCDSIAIPDWNCNGVSRVGGTDHTFRGASFVEDLRRSGYYTVHVGKAHWGAIDTPGENPVHWGFVENVTGSAAGGLATYLSEYNYGHDEEGNPVSPFAIEGLEKYWGTGVFATEALTREAISKLEKATVYNQPWFLYMSHYAVHVPIDRDSRFYGKYLDWGLSPKEAAYASLVEGMDKSLGDLLDWIDQSGQAENTIVIFMADNGGLAADPNWRDGALHTQNSPLRSGKGSLLEGGIREPMIVRWPGHTEAASRCDRYVMIEDFFPSILEMAGVGSATAAESVVDGVSFVPLIDGTGDPSAGRPLVWNFPNVWGLEGPWIDLCCAIRKDNWKLLYNYATGRKELYDIRKDIGEKNDLSALCPTTTRQLSRELGEILRSMDAQRPSFKSSGEPCPWPDEL
ncbi:MAG: sulfatase [Clostridium sp.]|nr:sulfatase [Clostridium sp.]